MLYAEKQLDGFHAGWDQQGHNNMHSFELSIANNLKVN